MENDLFGGFLGGGGAGGDKVFGHAEAKSDIGGDVRGLDKTTVLLLAGIAAFAAVIIALIWKR